MAGRSSDTFDSQVSGSSEATRSGAVAPERRVTDSGVSREDPARYELGDEIGRGGLGRVVAASDRFLGRRIAVKELLGRPLPDGTPGEVGSAGRTRFLLEARVTARLEHPAIVPVYELGERPDGALYYTMREVRGRSLAAAIAAAGSLDARLALVPHFVAVCQAIAYAHSRGVLHRDLKPQNVMVGEFGETVVLDWGLAKVVGATEPTINALGPLDADLTAFGSVLGTPSYMSPEQALGQSDLVDEQSDVWALGAILFSILTGRPPHQGPDALSVVRSAASLPAVAVLSIEPRAPPELCAIVERALARERQNRYRGAKELAVEVEAWLAGRRVEAYRYSTTEILRRFVRRNRVAVGVASVAMSVLIAGAVASYVGIRAERDLAQASEARTRIAELRATERLGAALGERASSLAEGGDWMEASVLAASAIALVDSPEIRGILLAAASRPLSTLLAVHRTDHPCGSLAFSADGHTLACGKEGGLRVWSRGEERTFPGDPGRVYGLGFGADGALISGGAEGIVKSVDIVTGQIAWTWIPRPGSSVRGIDTNPEGWLAAAVIGPRETPGCLVLRAPEAAPSPAPRCGPGALWDVRFSPDGRRVATAGGDGLTVTETANGRVVLQVPVAALAVDWSPDGATVAWTGADGAVFSTPLDGSAPSHFGPAHEGAAWTVRFLDAGRFVTGSVDRTARVWDVDGGAESTRLAGAKKAVYDLAIYGDRLAAAGLDGLTREWNVAPPDPIRAALADRFRVAALPDAAAALLWRDQELQVLERGSGALRCEQRLEAEILHVEPGSGRSPVLATADGVVRLLDPRYCTSTVVAEGSPIWGLSASTDGSAIGVFGDDGSVRIFSLPEGQPTGAWAMPPRRDDFAPAPLLLGDGQTVCTVAPSCSVSCTRADAAVRNWRPEGCTGRWGMSVRPDRSMVALGGDDGAVSLVALDTGAARSWAAHEGAVRATAWSADGRAVITGGSDGVLRVWETGSGRLRASFTAERNRISDIQHFEDGLFSTLAYDGQAHLWDLSDWETPAADFSAAIERRFGLHVEGASVVSNPDWKPTQAVDAAPGAPNARLAPER